MASFARSAEILKQTWAAGWAAAGAEARFIDWVNRLMLPALNNEMLQRLPLANWQATVAGVSMGATQRGGRGCRTVEVGGGTIHLLLFVLRCCTVASFTLTVCG